jgi:hypothetical protein
MQPRNIGAFFTTTTCSLFVVRFSSFENHLPLNPPHRGGHILINSTKTLEQ